MKQRSGTGLIWAAAGLLAAALICYNVATAPPRVPASIAFSPAPVLNPYPELDGVVVHINRPPRRS